MISHFARRIARQTSGNVAITVALLMPTLVGFGGLATDLGLAYLERRTMQAAADAAAIAAIRNPFQASEIASATFAKSLQDDVSVKVTFGTFDPAVHRDQRFLPKPELTVGQALRVTATKHHGYTLARVLGLDGVELSVEADAAIDARLVYSAGSRLLGVDPHFLNEILSETVGAKIYLSALDYQNLEGSAVSIRSLLQQHSTEESTEAAEDIHSGTLLQTSVLLMRMSDALKAEGDLMSAAVIRNAAISPFALTTSTRIDDIVKIGEGGINSENTTASQLSGARISVLAVLESLLRQSLSGHNAAADLAIPSIGKVGFELRLGEGLQSSPALAVASVGDAIETGQLRMRLNVETSKQLAILGFGITVPIELMVAGGRAEVVDIACSADPSKRSVTLAVTPGVARISLGRWSKAIDAMAMADRLEKERIVKAATIQLEAVSNVAIENMKPVLVTFKGNEITKGATKTVKTNAILTSPISSLFDESEISAATGLGGLSIFGKIDLVRNLLAQLTTPLDGLLNKVFQIAGVGIGEIDVRVDDLMCQNAKIVG